MLLSSIAFSQTVTKKPITDSIIPLPKPVAKEVVKDLIRKDSLEVEVSVIKKNNNILENTVVIKDSIIKYKDNIIELQKEKEKNHLLIEELKDAQKSNLEKLAKDLNRDLKKQKLKLFARTTFGVIIIGGLTYLILK